MNPSPRPSRRYAEYVRKIACHEWTVVGLVGGDKVVLRHTSGATAAYGTHDGGNEWNGPRNFAADVQKACGCKLIEPRGRKRSRKRATSLDAELTAARRRHALSFQKRADERDELARAERERERQAAASAADDRRRRSIEELMR